MGAMVAVHSHRCCRRSSFQLPASSFQLPASSFQLARSFSRRREQSQPQKIRQDDQANNLQDFAEGIVRAYDLATTAPMGPVFVVSDADQQEEEIEPGRKLFIPKLRKRSQPTGDAVALAEAAKMLVAAENPVIIAGRYQRTAEGPKLLSQLAETLNAPVALGVGIDPNRHQPWSQLIPGTGDMVLEIELKRLD